MGGFLAKGSLSYHYNKFFWVTIPAKYVTHMFWYINQKFSSLVHSESQFNGPRFSGFRGLTDKFSKPNFSIIILSRFNGFNGFSYIFDLADIF